MTGQRQAELLAATNLLLDARRTTTPIPDLPASLQPTTLDEAFYLQSQLIQSFGDIGGWKVGAPTAEGNLLAAPMPAAWIAPNAAILAAPHFRFRGLEAEVVFRLGSDLPPRAEPYTVDEVSQAIESCHPAIEILESALTDPTEPAINRLSVTADLQMHGGFVFGPACPTWRTLDFSKESVSLAIDGSIRAEHTASNTRSNFFLNLVVLLANQGSARTGGLRSGQFITTGSWTGVTRADANSSADVRFSTLGRVSLSFG